MITITTPPPPEKRPKATPLLRVLTRLMPGKNFSLLPRGIDERTIALVAWSRPTTITKTIPTRSHAPPVREAHPAIST